MSYLCRSLDTYSILRISSWIIKTAPFIIHLIPLQQIFCTGLLPRDDGIEQTSLSHGEAPKQGSGFRPKEPAPASSTVLNPPTCWKSSDHWSCATLPLSGPHIKRISSCVRVQLQTTPRSTPSLATAPFAWSLTLEERRDIMQTCRSSLSLLTHQGNMAVDKTLPFITWNQNRLVTHKYSQI